MGSIFEILRAKRAYILSGQKLIKDAKNCIFWRVFRKPEDCGQTVLPDRLVLIGQKLVEIAKMPKFKCDISNMFGTLNDIFLFFL